MESLEDKDARKVEKIARATINYLLKFPNTSRSKITNLKGKFAKKFSYARVIKNATVLSFATEQEKTIITKILKRRTTRTISGVSVIAIMTEPLECPGKCVYCPGKESQPGDPVAKSYTGREPAAMRSIHNNYDSFRQVRSRIEDLEAIGHKVDKIELIVMGGTFLSADTTYQTQFIKGALEGIIGKRTKSLKEAIKIAEESKRRIIGLTIETRPDHCKEPHVDKMLNYGTTRVEIGIQTVFDEIYNLINRGHTTKDSIEANRIAKDAGLKINAHMMPNLPGSNLERDLQTFEILFSNPNYKPDMIKIYPCLVIKGTGLYNWWKEGTFSPYLDEDLIDLIAKVKQIIPPYVRIQRIMRDIPAYLIEAGCKKSNLRQLVLEKLEKDKAQCNCIRCREYGIANRRRPIDHDSLDDVKLYRMDYVASQGKEIFLSFENKKENYLVGYLRLRKPSEYAHRPELNDGNTLIVREIKVVGELVPTDLKPRRVSQIQHRGYGTLLMEEAEKISSDEFDAKKLAVISGIGVRDYFYDKGYNLDGPYVSKPI